MSVSEKRIKTVAVYISDKYNQLIISPYYYNKAGIYYQQEHVFELDLNVDIEELGEQVIRYLDQFVFKEKNLRDTKLSDWAAYKAGKSKSGTSFENDYFFISVTELTADSSTVRIEALPFKNSEITLNSLVSRNNAAEVGRLIMKQFEICKTGQI